MAGSGTTLHDTTMHPPGKAATGGQSRTHRPVSAMPAPSSRTYYQNTPRTQGQQVDPSILATISNAAYADRRASAHPTLPSASQSTGQIAPPMSLSPSNMDQLTSSAISQGVPITSPAALQYFAAHPRRQQVHFGSYLLLQTLGEGEFGKVKLGVHKEWGEEVAVKLIKRDKVGTPDGQLQITSPASDPSKMSKVEKEICVLKDVRHPNIVRLYEVIESDRYIGIVLEYASGGELFDHILAHKYLKERDACRLFAQLISGVNYLHEKKIVHRDLKLENLLLDRNRNVIITDFGFANNFENKRDDLMATSCGSPCYAAPELVVQDGLYAGSAVDVWSCGVILYAMLAGYLPFDDDPANPDGDNINLLYKYIMATPLSFPDYITAEPRDLLCKMLVPDPVQRADLNQVMLHPWLAPYRDLFKFSVDELERAAIEQQNKKRQVYRQQMLLQQQMQEHQRSGRSAADAAAQQMANLKQQRHRSAMAGSSTMPNFAPDIKMDTSLSRGNTRAEDRAGAAQYATPQNQAMIPPEETGASDLGRDHVAPPSAKKNAGQKTQRHTIQLEYDSGAAQQRQQRRKSSAASRDAPLSPAIAEMSPQERVVEGEHGTDSSPGNADSLQIPAQPIIQAAAADTDTPAAPGLNGASSKIASSQGGAITSPEMFDKTIETSKQSRTPDGSHALSTPAIGQENVDARNLSPTASPQTQQGSSVPHVSPRIASSASRRTDGAQKGASPDRFSFARLLGSSNELASGGMRTPAGPASNDQESCDQTSTPVATPGRKTSSSRRKTMSLVVGRNTDPAEKEREKAAKAEKRLTARLRKETLKESTRPSTPRRSPSALISGPSPSSDMAGTSPQRRVSPAKQGTPAGGFGPFDSKMNNDSASTVGPSSSAAKKVMDWFRKRSLNRTAADERPPLGPFEINNASPAQTQPRKISAQTPQTPQTPGPHLVVTGDQSPDKTSAAAEESAPSSRSTSGTHSQVSQTTESTGITAATEDAPGSTASRQKSSSSTVQQTPSQQATPRASATAVQKAGPKSSAVNESALRVHQGAVDQSALTSRKPLDVFDRVQRALWEMGIDASKESGDELKLECVRRKRAKTLIGATQGLGQTLRTSVFPPSQADFERSASYRPSTNGGLTGAALPASPSAAGSIRSFLRRSSHAQPSQQGGNAGSDDGTPSQGLPAPMYGEPAVDGGQEVRFSVEVTRIRNLPGLYSVDIRRMKGNLWAYKWIYHTLLDRCQLSGVAAVRPASPIRTVQAPA